jgi:hypothetical protein
MPNTWTGTGPRPFRLRPNGWTKSHRSGAGNPSFTLTLAQTFLWLTEAGVLTAGAAWPADPAPVVRLAVVNTAGGAVTTIVDARVTLWSRTTSGLALTGGTMDDGSGVVVVHTGTTNGTKLAGTASEKLGFWGAVPDVQPSGATQAALTDSTGADLSTFDLSAVTASALTDSSGGTPSSTIPAITDGPTADAVASLAAAVNALRADVQVANRNAARVARLANSVRAALVRTGIMKGSV